MTDDIARRARIAADTATEAIVSLLPSTVAPIKRLPDAERIPVEYDAIQWLVDAILALRTLKLALLARGVECDTEIQSRATFIEKNGTIMRSYARLNVLDPRVAHRTFKPFLRIGVAAPTATSILHVYTDYDAKHAQRDVLRLVQLAANDHDHLHAMLYDVAKDALVQLLQPRPPRGE